MTTTTRNSLVATPPRRGGGRAVRPFVSSWLCACLFCQGEGKNRAKKRTSIQAGKDVDFVAARLLAAMVDGTVGCTVRTHTRWRDYYSMRVTRRRKEWEKKRKRDATLLLLLSLEKSFLLSPYCPPPESVAVAEGEGRRADALCSHCSLLSFCMSQCVTLCTLGRLHTQDS